MNACSVSLTAPAALSHRVIQLPSALDREAAGRLKADMLELQSGTEWTIACKCFRIQAGQVETLTTAALQVLVAMAREAAAAGVRFEWESVSPAAVKAFRLAGAASLLGMDECAPTEGVGEGCRRPY